MHVAVAAAVAHASTQQRDHRNNKQRTVTTRRERFSDGDKSCDEPIIPQVSGYCLCEGNVTAARCALGVAASGWAGRRANSRQPAAAAGSAMSPERLGRSQRNSGLDLSTSRWCRQGEQGPSWPLTLQASNCCRSTPQLLRDHSPAEASRDAQGVAQRAPAAGSDGAGGGGSSRCRRLARMQRAGRLWRPLRITSCGQSDRMEVREQLQLRTTLPATAAPNATAHACARAHITLSLAHTSRARRTTLLDKLWRTFDTSVPIPEVRSACWPRSCECGGRACAAAPI